MASLLQHASRYSLGSILTLAASLISFPVLTRLLSVEEYGLLSTVSVTLALLVAIGKLGMQSATLRFFQEAAAASGTSGVATLASTQVFGMTATGLVTAALWSAAVLAFAPHVLSDTRIQPLLVLGTGLVVIRVVDSACSNLLYARESSGTLTVLGVGKRYLTLLLTIAALLAFQGTASNVVWSMIVAEAICLALVVWILLRRVTVHWRHVSGRLFLQMAAFGIPMIGSEIAGSLLSAGDRYVIQYLLGTAMVGVYSAAYNLCEAIKMATVAALATAVAPALYRMWANDGRAATEQFLATFSRRYVAFALLVAALVSTNAHPLITLLAGSKFAEGAAIVPWVMLGLALDGYVSIAAAGLMLQKRTVMMFVLLAGAAVLNLGLNVLLIPHLGLMGAALATLLSYAALMLAALALGRLELSVPLPLVTLLGSGVAFGATTWIGSALHTPWLLGDLVCRSLFTLLFFPAVALLVDAKLRRDVARLLSSIRQRRGWGTGA